jgi:hypothetical protein
MNFKLDPTKLSIAQIEMLAMILAHQEAQKHLLVEALGKDELDKDNLNAFYADSLKEAFAGVLHDLFERHGLIDLKDILGKK